MDGTYDFSLMHRWYLLVIHVTRVSVIVVLNLQFLLELTKWLKSEHNTAIRTGRNALLLSGHSDKNVLAGVFLCSWREWIRRALLPLFDRRTTHGRRKEVLPMIRNDSWQNVSIVKWRVKINTDCSSRTYIPMHQTIRCLNRYHVSILHHCEHLKSHTKDY